MSDLTRFPLNLRPYDRENLEIAMMLNPSIGSKTDFIRAAIAMMLSECSTAEQIAKARREYRKQKEAKQ